MSSTSKPSNRKKPSCPSPQDKRIQAELDALPKRLSNHLICVQSGDPAIEFVRQHVAQQLVSVIAKVAAQLDHINCIDFSPMKPIPPGSFIGTITTPTGIIVEQKPATIFYEYQYFVDKTAAVLQIPMTFLVDIK